MNRETENALRERHGSWSGEAPSDKTLGFGGGSTKVRDSRFVGFCSVLARTDLEPLL
jgi:hypothetical protein